MNNQKRKIGIAILIIILVIAICMVILSQLKKEQNVEEVVEGEGDEIVEYQTQQLRDPAKFFSIESCIQKNEDEDFEAKDMNYLAKNIYLQSFAVYGKTKNNEDSYYIVRVDMENSTFIIEPLEKKYQSINQINLETEIEEIPNDGNNTFELKIMTDEEVCRMYYQRFSKLEIENTEEAYELLDKDYRQERFPSYQDYEKYVEAYQKTITEGILSKYSVDYQDDYTEYVLVDTYQNSYTLRAKGVLDYTIKLDNYTIKIDDYEENYNKLSDNNKIQSNVYIFLQMINTKDTKHAYELLDDTFKADNFPSLEEFEEYVQNNFFYYNLKTGDTSIKQEGNYYIYETIIKEFASNAAQAKRLTVIMKLEEGTNFVMSFSLE